MEIDCNSTTHVKTLNRGKYRMRKWLDEKNILSPINSISYNFPLDKCPRGAMDSAPDF